MERLEDCSDERNRAMCIHCWVGLNSGNANEDHVPSKCLLDRPLPDYPPTVMICAACNASFSRDEEYLCVFLAAVISGDVDPDPSLFRSAAASLKRSPGLRERIRRAQSQQLSLSGKSEILWYPELDRVNRVIVKNARGHVHHELGEPVAGAPSRVACWPVSGMSIGQRNTFERVSLGSGSPVAGWPEVGSRMMQRLAGVAPLADGWIEVQGGVYRYAVIQDSTELVVRSLIRDYLATEVAWELDERL